MRYETSVDIDADPARVWAVLVDVERWPEWTASMRRVERLDDGPFGIGSRVRITQPRLPVVVWQVTEFDEPHAFVWRARNLGVTTDAAHRVGAVGGGAVTVTLTIDQRGPLAWLVRLFAGRLTRRYLHLEANGLKQRSEAGPDAG